MRDLLVMITLTKDHIEALYELDDLEYGKEAREVRPSLILFYSSKY